MHRFFCHAHDVSAETVSITDHEQIHHIRDVLRLKIGEPAMIFDGAGAEYECALLRIEAHAAVFALKKKRSRCQGHAQITIGCALAKHAKIDDIIDKLTQLGVDRIIPLLTQRVIVRLDNAKKAARSKRWEKIALAATKQSQRSTVTRIDPVTDIKAVLAQSKDFDLKLIPHLGGDCKDLKAVLAAHRPKSVLILIGPEGDFSPAEVSLAVKAGFIPVTFGDFVLRVETACLYAASILRYETSP